MQNKLMADFAGYAHNRQAVNNFEALADFEVLQLEEQAAVIECNEMVFMSKRIGFNSDDPIFKLQEGKTEMIELPKCKSCA